MSRSVSLVGVDSAGGTIIGGGQSLVKVNGIPLAVVGDRVASHGNGSHSSATMVQGSSVLRIMGMAVVAQGDSASCGHTATGSAPIRIP